MGTCTHFRCSCCALFKLLFPKENPEQKQKFDLINISDDELDEDELKQKQKQVMLRAAALRRDQIRLMKELKRNKVLIGTMCVWLC